MTALEAMTVLNVRTVLAYELSRYESSVRYWTEGDGSKRGNAQKNIDYNRSRIDAIQVAIKQCDLLASNPS